VAQSLVARTSRGFTLGWPLVALPSHGKRERVLTRVEDRPKQSPKRASKVTLRAAFPMEHFSTPVLRVRRARTDSHSTATTASCRLTLRRPPFHASVPREMNRFAVSARAAGVDTVHQGPAAAPLATKRAGELVVGISPNR